MLKNHFCEGQHALASRGCSPGWNTKGVGGLARSFLHPFPCPQHGYSSCPGAVLVTELDRKGCVLFSVRVSAPVSAGLLLLQSNMIILAFPGLGVLEIHLCFASGFPGNSSRLCFVFMSLFPGKAVAVTAEKSNEVLDWGLFFSLHSHFGPWEGDDPYVSEGIGKRSFRNAKKTAFLSCLPSFPLSLNHHFIETSRGFFDELLASLCSNSYFMDRVVHMGTSK